MVETTGALLAPDECASVVKWAEAQAKADGGWATTRHYEAPTTDIEVQRIARILPWFNRLLEVDIFPLLASRFPALAPDGAKWLRVNDAFVVRYDAAGGQVGLPPHRDESALSMTIALSDVADYEGGGTRMMESGDGGAYEDLVFRLRQGFAVAHPGMLPHQGVPITKGVRYVLALFVVSEEPSFDNPGDELL